MELPIRGVAGQFRAFLTMALPQRDDEGKIVRWFGTSTDVSVLKMLREELENTAARLEEEDRRKDEFLAMLAHELRNPLAPIRSGLEWMRLRPEDAVGVSEVRAMMERQTHQLIALVDDLLDVSRIRHGKLELRRRTVALADVVGSAVEECEPVIRKAGHHLTVSLPEEPVPLYADSRRMTQALSNLLNNAAKYTPDGGAIAVRAEVSSGMVAISVEDSGVGIPASRIGEVFEMFARLNPEAGREHGLGIGLTLAKRLVEMHGGKVEARSEGENRGSVFTVSLPVAEGGQANSPAGAITEDEGTARDEPYTGAPRRLLIVDDNRDAAELLAMIATQMGHEVRTAHDGAEAIEAGSAFLPDTILMDLGMPNMNGYEAATQIRKLPWGANVALIALTGWGQQSDRERSRDAGFDAHLVKPVEVAEVRRALETVRHRPN